MDMFWIESDLIDKVGTMKGYSLDHKWTYAIISEFCQKHIPISHRLASPNSSANVCETHTSSQPESTRTLQQEELTASDDTFPLYSSKACRLDFLLLRYGEKAQIFTISDSESFSRDSLSLFNTGLSLMLGSLKTRF